MLIFLLRARRLTALSMIGLMVAATQPRSPVKAAPVPDDPEAPRLSEAFDAVLTELRALRQDLPSDRLAPAAILAETGAAPEALLAWVRERTALVAYRGALRGAEGVLLDRDANSLDRALLLDRLLVLAGHETRLARGRLSETDALALAEAARAMPPSLPHETAPAVESAAVVERAYDRIEQQVSDLVERLTIHRLPAEATGERELHAAAEALSDHWWPG